MARHARQADGRSPPPARLPIDQSTWEMIARKLELSAQQERIVCCLLMGMQDKEIAVTVGIGLPTITTYFNRIFRKVGVQNRVELILRILLLSQSIASNAGCHESS
jgi:DNA-binding NarL/FixJ family response regulator